MRIHQPQYYVYIMASGYRGTLYIGVTHGLLERVEDHRSRKDPGSFTARYAITLLVYFETYQYIDQAIQRETNLKRWNREWKIRLIESVNPKWDDLYEQLIDGTYEEKMSPYQESKQVPENPDSRLRGNDKIKK